VQQERPRKSEFSDLNKKGLNTMLNIKSNRLIAPLAIVLFAGTAIAGPRGTTIEGYKTANAIYTETKTYEWSLDKANPPDQVPYVIPTGETQFATFSITATRIGPVIKAENSDVTGQVCVKNTGNAATRGLQISDRLEVLNGTNWVPVTTEINLPVLSQVGAGQETCYPYSFGVVLDPSKQYRNHASLSIDNFSGFEGTKYTLPVKTDLVIDSQLIVINESVKIFDIFTCPAGFSCRPLNQDWIISATTVIPVEISITNDSVECGQTIGAINKAKLASVNAPSGSELSLESSAPIQIFTGSCPTATCPVSSPDSRCEAPASFTFQSAQSGDWTAGSTWVGGVAPSIDVNNQRVRITHDVVVQSGSIKLLNGSVIQITSGGRLTIRNGNLEMLDGNQSTTEKVLVQNGTLRTSGNVQQSGTATVFCSKTAKLEIGDEDASSTPSVFTSGFFSSGNSATSANFQNTSGFRRLEDSCMNVTASIQNTAGEDQFIGVCGEIGDRGTSSGALGNAGGFDGQDSGNFDVASNTGTSTTICQSEFYIANGNVANSRNMRLYSAKFRLTNGSFGNQSSGVIEGEDVVIWINHPTNGNILNQGTWPSNTVSAWRVDGTNLPVGLAGIVDESSLGEILARFQCKLCTASFKTVN
jgi:hypothetical protein